MASEDVASWLSRASACFGQSIGGSNVGTLDWNLGYAKKVTSTFGRSFVGAIAIAISRTSSVCFPPRSTASDFDPLRTLGSEWRLLPSPCLTLAGLVPISNEDRI